MSTFETTRAFDGDPGRLMMILTEVDAIERWSPVPFQIVSGMGGRLRVGKRIALNGGLLGRTVSFQVEVVRADETVLSLRASGAFDIDVDYRIESDRGQVRARIETQARRPLGQLLASATNAMLNAGALDRVLTQLVREASETPRTVCLAA